MDWATILPTHYDPYTRGLGVARMQDLKTKFLDYSKLEPGGCTTLYCHNC